MKGTLIFTLLFVGLVIAEIELPLAVTCDEDACQLPDCRCSSTNIPGGLAAKDTPQFVLLTFDDAITTINMETYRDLVYNRKNKNTCPIGVTYFVNHEYTDYSLVNELYNQGFEIALHSISHQTVQEYWREASVQDMEREFGDQIGQMSHFANIPEDSIKGVRIPFLQMTGNASFQAMAMHGLQYDLTWPTNSFINPGLWPYTLDYASTQDCVILPCPSASIPGVWIIPMISWLDINGTPCSMVDSCHGAPTTEEEWFDLMLSNFERHYLGNRAPFGFYIHEWYLRINTEMTKAFIRFLDLLNNLDDVFMVNAKDVIEWSKNPISVAEYVQQPCKRLEPASCPVTTCPLQAEHNGNTYYMTICTGCPKVYPWLGNPLGK